MLGDRSLPMSFWQFFEERITRLLGIAQGTVAIIAGTTGIIPDKDIKYWLLASAILVYWRGQSTAKVYTQAKTVLASQEKS